MGKGYEIFMGNSYWKEQYENAPSENLKEYYRLMFDYKSFVSDDEMPKEVVERLCELWLTKEDLLYLRDKAHMGIAKHNYSKFIHELEVRGEGTCVAAIVCTGEIRNPWYKPVSEND